MQKRSSFYAHYTCNITFLFFETILRIERIKLTYLHRHILLYALMSYDIRVSTHECERMLSTLALASPFLQPLYVVVGADAYTKINLLWAFLALWVKVLRPYVFVNSVAIFTSFYATWFFDPESFTTFHGAINPHQRFLLLWVVHTFPISWFRPKTMDWHVGFVTMFHHLAWGLSQNADLRLNDVYHPLQDHIWKWLWIIGCFTHMFTPIIWS